MKSRKYFLLVLAILMLGTMLPLQQAQSQDNDLITVTAKSYFNDTVAKFKKMVAKNGQFLRIPTSNCPTGTLDGSRIERKVLLKPFMTAFCQFERRSLFYGQFSCLSVHMFSLFSDSIKKRPSL